MIRIVLADDHRLVMAGLRALLEQAGDMEIAGEAGDGREAVRMVQELEPDVLVLDLGLPELNGIEVITRLRHEEHQVAILVLSMHSGKEYVARAFREGASGYLVKDSAEPELAVAVKAVASGQRYVSSKVAGPLIEELASRPPSPDDPYHVLTPRQREVLQLVAEGYGTREIADALCVSVKTVETHRSDLMKRLDIHSVAGLTRYAMRNRLTPEGPTG